jgi:hypothetical protein
MRVASIGAERDQGMVLGEGDSSVVTSIFGRPSSEVQDVIRQFKEGKVYKPGSSQIEYVPFNQKFPENLTPEMNSLLLSLRVGKINTNVTLSKP